MSADIASTNISHAWLHFEKIYWRKSQQPRGLAAKIAPISGGKVGLERIPEVGPEIAAAVVAFFDNEDNRQVLEKMWAAGVEIEDSSDEVSDDGQARVSASQALSGKTFVFTGELEHYSRREAQSAVEVRGGRATSDVSSATDYLVRGKDPGSKAERAKELGIETLDEADFEQLLKQGISA